MSKYDPPYKLQYLECIDSYKYGPDFDYTGPICKCTRCNNGYMYIKEKVTLQDDPNMYLHKCNVCGYTDYMKRR